MIDLERVTLYRGVLVPLLQRVVLVRKVESFRATPIPTIAPATVRAQFHAGDGRRAVFAHGIAVYIALRWLIAHDC